MSGMSMNGYNKLQEEMGESVQVIAKQLAYWGHDYHPDGGPSLKSRIEDELADVMAAIDFVIAKNGLNRRAMESRKARKLTLYQEWDANPVESPFIGCISCENWDKGKCGLTVLSIRQDFAVSRTAIHSWQSHVKNRGLDYRVVGGCPRFKPIDLEAKDDIEEL